MLKRNIVDKRLCNSQFWIPGSKTKKNEAVALVTNQEQVTLIDSSQYTNAMKKATSLIDTKEANNPGSWKINKLLLVEQ